MDNLKKSFLIVALIIGIVAISIAFAALSTNLSISGTASVGDVSWNIHFTNWQLDTESTVTYGGNTHENTASYPTVNQLLQSPTVEASTKVENLNVTLRQPGDYAKYTFEIINEGSIDATLSSFTYPLTCESGKNCSHLTYIVSCKDNTKANDFVVNSTLNSGEKAYCYLSVTYNDQTNSENSVYTQESVSANLSADFTFIQKQTGSSQGGNSGSGSEQIVVPAGSYLVTYDSNGGTGSMSGQVIDPTMSNTLSSNTYTRSGYVFTGWNTQADGMGTTYMDEHVLSSNTISANITLYAQWVRDGWVYENEATWNSNTNELTEQRWKYYRNGTQVQNELLYVDGTYKGSVVSMHHYLIENGYMYIGWHEDGNNNWNFYSWYDLDNNGYVEGYRVEGRSMEIDGVTYTFDANGVASPSPNLTPSNPYETTFNGNYIAYKWIDVDTSGYVDAGINSGYWYTSLNPNSKAYLRTTGSLPEACGVFGNGQAETICMTSSYYNNSYSSNYNADFLSCSSGGTGKFTSGDISNSCLTGYALSKAEEMLVKGASYCYVSNIFIHQYNSDIWYVECGLNSDVRVRCNIRNDGQVGCYTSNDGTIYNGLAVYPNGSS